MFGIFKSKTVLSKEDTEFQIATYKWLLTHFGGDDFYNHAKLVLPTNEFFPAKVEEPAQIVQETFNAVKKHSAMEEWDCRLMPMEEDEDPRVAPTLVVQNAPHSPLGTFEVKNETEVVISYNPSLANNPAQLVATLAHELSHYLTATAPEPPPGGYDNWEFATDITATFLGFGVFMANSAFNFRQYAEVDSQGWSYSRSGYLTEAEHIYALAIFLLLKKISFEQASTFLKPSLKKLLKKSLKELADTGYIDELLQIAYVPRTS